MRLYTKGALRVRMHRSASKLAQKLLSQNVGDVAVSGLAKVFGDEVAASAIADRVCHHCRMIKITGRSYRLKDLLAESRRKEGK